jgi:hypothetical protein
MLANYVVVLLACWFNSMPAAATALAACLGHRCVQSGQTSPTGQLVRVEWAGSAKPIGVLRIQPGRPGTADQIVKFLVAHSDHLVDAVLFNGHNGKHLVLDDNIQLGNVLVVTSGILSHLVVQPNVTFGCVSGVLQCAQKHWCQLTVDWTRKVLESQSKAMATEYSKNRYYFAALDLAVHVLRKHDEHGQPGQTHQQLVDAALLVTALELLVCLRGYGCTDSSIAHLARKIATRYPSNAQLVKLAKQLVYLHHILVN